MNNHSLKYCLLLGLLAASCGPEQPSAGPEGDEVIQISSEGAGRPVFHPEASRQPVLLILGSTFSVARGLSPELAYAALLQQNLAENQVPLTALNASVADETVAGATERLRYLLAHPLAQVILELGQADERRGTAPNAFSRDVKKLLQQIRTQHPEAPILILASAHTTAYFGALEASATEVDGVRLSTLLTKSGQEIRSDDSLMQRQLAEQLWPLILQNAGN